MNKTSTTKSDNKITVDTAELMNMLCCGKRTATSIGEKAGAVIKVGRRKLYSVKKVEAYLEKITEA